MIKKIAIFITLCLITNLPASQASAGKQVIELDFQDILVQNITKMRENTALLQAFLKMPQGVAAANARNALNAQTEQLNATLAQARQELQAEQDELNAINAFTRTLATTASLRAAIANYDKQVLPNKIKSLYAHE